LKKGGKMQICDFYSLEGYSSPYHPKLVCFTYDCSNTYYWQKGFPTVSFIPIFGHYVCTGARKESYKISLFLLCILGRVKVVTCIPAFTAEKRLISEKTLLQSFF